ncbi:LOW QUALITY PROTEIN: hypothetical protein HID58_058984, partial [Brassica napus]
DMICYVILSADLADRTRVRRDSDKISVLLCVKIKSVFMCTCEEGIYAFKYRICWMMVKGLRKVEIILAGKKKHDKIICDMVLQTPKLLYVIPKNFKKQK